MTWQRKEVIGNATLYLGDCAAILPGLPVSDALVTDPPYGIGMANGVTVGGEGLGGKPRTSNTYEGDWDNAPPSRALFRMMLAAANHAIIFGGNYFTDCLPVGRHWLVWDKKNTMPTYSDCELAWTNLDKRTVKRVVYESNGMLSPIREVRVHPTQKPEAVMRWCLWQLSEFTSVLDPFMGSGTTGVACVQMEKRFRGIERDPGYFDIACERIQRAYDEPMLFAPDPETATRQNDQTALL